MPTPSCGGFGPICDAEAMSSSTTRALLACLTALVLVALSGCSGADSPEGNPPASAAAKPVKALAKGTCWGGESLPEALGAKGFEAWVEKYAGGDKALGDSMRDDAAFSTPVDCSEPHALELYNIVGLDPRLDAQVKDYADLLDPEDAALPQGPRPGLQPLPRTHGVRRGAAPRGRPAGPARPVAERHGGTARRVGPVPGPPVGEGAAEVRLHLRAGRPGDADVRRPAHPQDADRRPASA